MNNFVLNQVVDGLESRVEGQDISDFTAADEGIVMSVGEGAIFFCLRPELPLPAPGARRSDIHSPFVTLAGRLKHFSGGAQVVGLVKTPADRVVTFELASPGGARLNLIYLAIPRKTELLLIDQAGRILISSRPRDEEVFQQPQRPQGKVDFFSSNEDELLSLFEETRRGEEPEKQILSAVSGMDPLLAAVLAKAVERGPEEAVSIVRELIRGEGSVGIFRRREGDDRSLELLPSVYRPAAGELIAEFDDVLKAAAEYAGQRLRAEALAEITSDLQAVLKRRRKRLERLRSNLLEEREKNEREARLGALGDLLLINLHRVRRGAAALEAEDIVKGDGSKVAIALDPALDPAANAERYYKRARKGRRALESVDGRFRELEREESELAAFEVGMREADGDFRRLRELRREMESAGWFSTKGRGKRNPAPALPPGRRFISSDGLEMVVGRNNRDNEVVTFQVGRDNDFWMHAAGYSGSHVVVRNPRRLHEPPPRTLAEAASLAAYYSKARQSSNVQVHWTLRRFVKKRKGGPAGQVLVTSYRSTVADPGLPPSVARAET